MRPVYSILIVVILSAVVALGDYFLKLASLEKRIILNKWFLIGMTVYMASAFGWVYVMPHIKLSSLGMIFSLSMVLMLAGVGVLGFGETLNRYEIAGMGLGIAAIVLLARISN